MGARQVGACAVVLVLFLGPLAFVGELGVWAFQEPVSNLVWDEGSQHPQQSGGTTGAGGGSGGGQGGGSGADGSADTGGSGASGGNGGSRGGGGSGSAGGVLFSGSAGGSGGGSFGWGLAGFAAFFSCLAGFWVWSGPTMAGAWAAWAAAWAAWAVALACTLALLAFAVLWFYLGIVGGVMSASAVGLAFWAYDAGYLDL